MTHLDKIEKAAKAAQIKALISTALEYFYPEELLEMLMKQCPYDMEDDFIDKCAEICTENNLFVLEPTTMISERAIKEFCKNNDVKIL